MSKSTSTTKIIKALQDFEAQHGESEVLDIVVLKEADRDDEYWIYASEPKSEETHIIKIKAEDRADVWKRLRRT